MNACATDEIAVMRCPYELIHRGPMIFHDDCRTTSKGIPDVTRQSYTNLVVRVREVHLSDLPSVSIGD